MSCQNCEKRHIGCHATCEDYKEYLKQNEAKKRKITKEKQTNAIVTGFVIDCINKQRRKTHC